MTARLLRGRYLKFLYLNFKHINCLLSVYDKGSISRAAEAVHLSQPAITQAISKIEARLDEKLFERTRKGLQSNESGEIFVARARRAQNLLFDGFQRATRASDNDVWRWVQGATTTQLRALIQLGESGSYSLAGRTLGIAHSSVHRSIRDLEQWSGIKIATAVRNGVRLTKQADALARTAKLAFAELQQGYEELQTLRESPEVNLAIGSMPLARYRLIASCLSDYLVTYPNARIRLDEGPFDDLLNRLLRGDLDILIGALRSNLDDQPITQTPLFTSELCWVASTSHPLTQKTQVELQDLLPYPFWINRPGTPMRQVFENQFLDAELDVPDRLIESSAHEVMLGLLDKTHTLAMVSKHMVSADLSRGRLVQLPLPVRSGFREIGHTVRDSFRPTRAQQVFLDLLETHAKRFNEGTPAQQG